MFEGDLSSVALRWYTQMLRLRKIELAIAESYPEQEMRCPVHLCVGQEAIAIGVCDLLSAQDIVMSTHRSHCHYLAKGGDLKRMLAEIYGKSTGCSQGKGGSMHLIDLPQGFWGATPIVGSTIPIGVGTAFGRQLRGEPGITVMFFGEGATEEGVFHEALNFAQLRKLPVLFVCENNLYSVYSPMEVRQSADRQVVDIAAGHGLFTLSGDGNNIQEVVALTTQALQKLSQGPCLIELSTYRWLEHCGPFYDNHIGYRTEEEFLAWKEKCPIAAWEKLLFEKALLTPDRLAAIHATIDEEIANAFMFAKTSPFPEPDALMRGVYA